MIQVVVSFVVGKIHVDVKGIYENQFGIYKVLDILHVNTRKFVIMNSIPIREGDVIDDTTIIHDIKAELLRKDIFYDVNVHYVLRNDTMDIFISVQDKFTLGIYWNLEGSGHDFRLDLGLSEMNLLGTGTYMRGFFKYTLERKGFSSEMFSNPLKNFYIGGYLSFDNLYRRTGIYYFKPYWRGIRDWGIGGGVHYYSDSTGRYRLFSSFRVSYNFTPNITAFGISISYRKSPAISEISPSLSINLSNRTFGFLKNVNDFSIDEAFSKGFDTRFSFSYNSVSAEMNLSSVLENLVSSFFFEFNNNSLALNVMYSLRMYYKVADWITLALYSSSEYLDVKDTLSYIGIEVGGFLGIRGLNYYYTFSDHLNRFVFELRFYTPELFKLFALGPVLFYDYAEFGESVWVMGAGIRFKLTRFSMPIMRFDYGCNEFYCIASFGAGQVF